MELKIEKLDNQGRGIGYINNKIIFVPKCLPGELINVKIVKNNKKYCEGKVIKIINSSSKRINSSCSYFDKCGGCNLLHLSYEDTLEYKKDKIKEIFKKYLNANLKINLIESKSNLNYRNKVIFRIENKEICLIDENNNVIRIDNCLMINNDINECIDFIQSLNISTGKVLVRVNYLNELLLSINSRDNINIKNINKNIVGIILNDKLVYGKDYFIDEINNLKFKVSYKSFFQINPYITSQLFNIIKENMGDCVNVLDLYCGVGTLGIVASSKCKKVIGIDNLKSNIEDAKYNKKLNNIKNIKFIEGDASVFDKYVNKIDTIIIDPPRNGINKCTIKNIINFKPKKILYISCDPFTLVRDLKELINDYKIEKYYLLDMFPFTHHVESACLLNHR